MLASWEIRAVLGGHGQPTTDQKEIRARFSRDTAYVTELRERVSQAVAQGKTLEETVALCAEMRLWGDYCNSIHKVNVEHAYLELGGDADPAEVGWEAWWWKDTDP